MTDTLNAADARALKARWVVQADLKLISAAAPGNGDSGTFVDSLVTRDPTSGSFILYGESLAGGLRSYLTDLECGYGSDEWLSDKDEHNAAGDVIKEAALIAAQRLFGSPRGLRPGKKRHGQGRDRGMQSALIVFDACSNDMHEEVRDGIYLHPERLTVKENFKFDCEVIPAETGFKLRLELLIAADDPGSSDPEIATLSDEEGQVRALFQVLQGLENEEIPVGRYKLKGLGACRAVNWRAYRFDLSTQRGWLEWLRSDHLEPIPEVVPAAELQAALQGAGADPGWFAEPFPDERQRAVFTLALEQTGGMLIGGGPGIAETNQLRSGDDYVLSGRALTGVLKARVRKIANTVGADGKTWATYLFGPSPEDILEGKKPRAAKVKASENVLECCQALVNTRVAIDAFTSGSVAGALFDETVVYGGKTTAKVELRRPARAEIGLLLLALSDLIREDVAIGGTAGIGRGRLKGAVTLTYDGQSYHFDHTGCADPEVAAFLNDLVEAFYGEKGSVVSSPETLTKAAEADEPSGMAEGKSAIVSEQGRVEEVS